MKKEDIKAKFERINNMADDVLKQMTIIKDELSEVENIYSSEEIEQNIITLMNTNIKLSKIMSFMF